MNLTRLNIDDKVPAHIHQGIEYYVLHGIKPGGFLEAVFCNDLRLAVSRADHTNLIHLKDIVLWIYWNLPHQCHGSKEEYHSWLNDTDGCRSGYADQIEKQFTLRVLQTEGQT